MWKCGGFFEATKEPKYLRSPDYHNRRLFAFNNAPYNCSYTIVTKDPQGFIKISVNDIQTSSDGK